MVGDDLFDVCLPRGVPEGGGGEHQGRRPAQENPNHSVKVETAGMPKFFGAIEEGFEAVFRGCGGARVGLRGALRHEA